MRHFDERDATFFLEEFKSLRSEIQWRLDEQRTTERSIILANAAVYSAIVFRNKPDVESILIAIAWWLPPIISVLGFVKWRESIRTLGDLAAYIRTREPAADGWEAFLLKRRNDGHPTKLALWYMPFWGILTGGPTGLALFSTLPQTAKNVCWSIGLGLAVAAAVAATIVVGNLRALAPAQASTPVE